MSVRIRVRCAAAAACVSAWVAAAPAAAQRAPDAAQRGPGAAQSEPGAARPAPAARQYVLVVPEAVAAAQQTSTGRAFLVEAAGGTAGSLLGFGVMYLLADDCDVEDTRCILESAFAALAVGTAASALGTVMLGRAADTNPSALGAVVGAVAGAGAGLGMWHLLTEELNVVRSTAVGVAVFAATQGAVTALGSRLVRALR